MNEDQFQRQVDFIVAQQAKFETNIGRLEQDIAENGKQTKENTQNIAKLADVVLSLANHVERHDKQIAELIEHGKETDRRSKETDERINALIGMAERFFNRNGN
jgi:chromosome segregation ATPase